MSLLLLGESLLETHPAVRGSCHVQTGELPRPQNDCFLVACLSLTCNTMEMHSSWPAFKDNP